MTNLDFTTPAKSLNTHFIGREYAFKAIDKLWTVSAGQPRSMLFWGDWNVGKSEVLWNVDKHYQNINVAYANLQCLGVDREDNDVWLALALALDKIDAIFLLNTVIFRDKDNAYPAFVEYLEQALNRHPNRKLLLAIDQYEEFLNIPGATIILKQLEALTLKHDRLAFLLCGSHDIGSDAGKAQLDFKPTRKFWLRFFTKEETAEFCNQQPYKFDADAIDRLHELTSGQPWLVRGLCFNIINEFNWATQEEHEIRSRVTIFDVEEFANSDRFYENHNPYFSSLWDRSISFGYITLQQVLLELVEDPDGFTVVDIALELGTRHTREVYEVCQAATSVSLLEKLKENGTEIYRVVIELFRRWIIRTQK